MPYRRRIQAGTIIGLIHRIESIIVASFSLTAKRLNSVINIDWNEQKIEWIIAPPYGRDSKGGKYALKDISVNDEEERKEIPICSLPECTSLMEGQ